MVASLPRRDRPGLSWALAGLPEPSQGSPGRPGGPRGGTNHLSHQTAGLTRTGSIGSQLLSHVLSAVELTAPVWCLRPSLRPRRRFDRSIGPSESQRAVPKSVRVVRPLPLPYKKRQVTSAVKVKSFGTGPGQTQSVVDRVPLLQHAQSFTLFLDAIWLTQMGALVALR